MKRIKIILLSMIVTIIAIPAFAVPSNTGSFPGNGLMQPDYTYTNAAVSTNMAGVYEGTVNATPRYTDDEYTVTAGNYLPAASESLATCTAGNFCPGLQNPVNYSATNNQGLETCPSGYDNSATGSTVNTDCYRTCANDDITHATGITGNVYYNGTDGDGTKECTPTACENGWHPKAATPDLTTIIDVTEVGGGYTSNDYTGADYNTDNMSNTIIANDPMAFAVDYGNGKGIIKGHGRCSKTGVTTPWYSTQGYTFASDHFVNNLTNETDPTNGGQYCYCQLDSYTASGSNTSIAVSGPWVFDGGGGVVGCANACAFNCAAGLRGVGTSNRAFRAAVFASLASSPASCEANTYNITYVMDNGTNYENAPTEYTYAIGATINGVPTKDDYTFAGWCTDSTLETCADTQTIGTSDTGDKTFYAKWTQCTACDATNASCTFDGVVDNACTYTTSCDTGYGNIQNNGAYNASCSPNTYNITLNTGINTSILPSGYTELEYIESTGTQYINTGIKSVVNSEFGLISQLTSLSGGNTLVGALDGTTGGETDFKVVLGHNTTNGIFTQCAHYGNYIYSHVQADTQKHTYKVVNTTNSQTLTIDDGTPYVGSYAVTTKTNTSLYLFARNADGTTNNYVSQKVYSFYVKQNDVLVQNLVPAKRNSDNEIGMYDTVTDTFFTNSGSGTFTAGPVSGSLAINQTYTYGVGATINDVPIRDGYIFAGWCTDSGLTSCAMTQTIGTDATGDKTFYAKWTQCTACDATNASCELSVENNICTYTTACNDGYYDIQNDGEYNASCSACGGDEYYCANGERHSVDSGYYATGGTETTHTGQSQCESGYYCVDGVRNECPSGYGNSAVGATAQNQCYRACATSDIEHSATVIGNDYYGDGTDTCGVMACENGYSVVGGTPNLTTTIGVTEIGTGYTSNDSTGSDVDTNGMSNTIISNDPMAFAIDYGAKGVIKGHGRCSTRAGTHAWTSTYNVIEGNIIDTLADETGTGRYCYCQLDSYTPLNDTAQSLSGPWVFNFDVWGSSDDCASNCAGACGYFLWDGDADDLSFRSAMFRAVEASSASCEANTYNISYVMNDGTNYENAPIEYTYATGATIDGVPTKDNYTFAGWCTDSTLETCAMSQTIGTSDYGDKTFYAKWTPNTYNISYVMDDGTNYENAPTEYTYATGATIDGVPTKDGYVFTGWCTDSELQNCAMSQTIGTSDYGDKTFYAKWGVQYNVTYSCGEGGGTPPANSTAVSGTIFTTATNSCTKPGYMIAGWGVSGTEDVKSVGSSFTWEYTENKTLTAQWVATQFSVTTTNLDANATFGFSMSAKGTFYIDWGDGIGEIITITSANGMRSFAHTYKTGGVKTVSFGGVASGYSNNSEDAPIRFEGVTSLASVEGNMSGMFPIYGSGGSDGIDSLNALHPIYNKTFKGCMNLTSISGTLFKDYSVGAYRLFKETFSGCTRLTTIPGTLFENIATGAEAMFYETFYNCTQLSSIPGSLFSKITTGNKDMFNGTFGGTGLTSIPEGLFSKITTGAENLFNETFSGCTSLTEIPVDLFSGITSSAGYMFDNTFSGCTSLGGYIPPTTFSGLILNDSPVSNYMWRNTFSNTQLLTACPNDTVPYITGYEGAENSVYTTWANKVSCAPANPVEMTLDAGEDAVASVPSTVYWKYNDGWYSDSEGTSEIASLTSLPRKSTSTFNGFRSSGIKIINGNGEVVSGNLTQPILTSPTTFEAEWEECAPCDENSSACTISVENNACVYTYTCERGYYLPANSKTCALCPENHYCTGGGYQEGAEDQGKAACSTGLFAPAGVWSAGQCGGILHIDEDIIHLRSAKQTTPSLNIDIDNDGEADFYANMTTEDVVMNADTDKKLKINYNDTTYSVYDDSVSVTE